jgi:hypothetical protein
MTETVKRGTPIMIFTRRFGALAARPTFRPAVEVTSEPTVDPSVAERAREQVDDATAA